MCYLTPQKHSAVSRTRQVGGDKATTPPVAPPSRSTSPAGSAVDAQRLRAGPRRWPPDPAGTFVAAWTDDNALSLRASTSPPGGGFGAPVIVGSNYGEPSQ